MNVRFRTALPSDRNNWVSMRHALWPQCPLDRHRLEIEQLHKSNGIVAVAEVADTLVGFAEVTVRSDHVEGTSIAPVPYLEGWYVCPDCRGRGIGAGLLRYVEQWAIQQGFSELASDAELDNTLSILLHSKLGFREAGRSVHFVKKLKKTHEATNDSTRIGGTGNGVNRRKLTSHKGKDLG